MKLKYRIAKSTELSQEAIVKKILLQIEKRKYGILDVTKNSVSFDDHNGGLVWNWEHARSLKSGKFEIINEGANNNVVFEYYPISLFEIIYVAVLCGIFLVVGIIHQVYFTGIISLVFFLQLIFKHYNLKSIVNEMLTEIVT
jgi:hypothetical protein